MHVADLSPQLMVAFIMLGIVLVGFLICREIVCWYWKINRVVELLERIANSLEAKNQTK